MQPLPAPRRCSQLSGLLEVLGIEACFYNSFRVAIHFEGQHATGAKCQTSAAAVDFWKIRFAI
jgi:hypothetical protein